MDNLSITYKKNSRLQHIKQGIYSINIELRNLIDKQEILINEFTKHTREKLE